MPGPAYHSGVMRIAKNEDWIVDFVYGTNEGDTFTPIDLTGSMLKWAIRKTEANHEAIVWTQSPGDGIVFTDATTGRFTVKISRKKLKHVPPGDYVSDLVCLRAGSGIQERIWEGTATVVQGTTP
jgi:hypothetical protein